MTGAARQRLAIPDQTDGTTAEWPIIGHPEVVKTLRRSLARNQVSHAYLLAGPAGIGKATLARVFARALCCQSGDRVDPTVPCGTCLACRKIERGVHPDVQLWSLETQRALSDKRGGQNTSLTIDTIRQLSADAAMRPMEAGRRIMIVDDAENMQGVAQEALLKTLEEPPPSILLLLLADDAGMLLPTIQSRCQVLQLRPVAIGAITDAVVGSGVDATQAREIAAISAGRPGWALQAARDRHLLDDHRAAIERAIVWIEGSTYQRLVTAVRLGDAYPRKRIEVFRDLEAVLAIWRDLMLVRAELIDLVVQQSAIDRLADLSETWELGAIARSVQSVQRCLADVESNVRPRLALESMVLQWPTHSRRS